MSYSTPSVSRVRNQPLPAQHCKPRPRAMQHRPAKARQAIKAGKGPWQHLGSQTLVSDMHMGKPDMHMGKPIGPWHLLKHQASACKPPTMKAMQPCSEILWMVKQVCMRCMHCPLAPSHAWCQRHCWTCPCSCSRMAATCKHTHMVPTHRSA